MDWVHCNACYVQPGTNGRKFFLTSCGHVFCQECIQANASQTCNVCKSSCNVIPLTSNSVQEHDELTKQSTKIVFQRTKAYLNSEEYKLKPEVEIFFMDPGDLLKKQQKQYLQVLEFQKSHRKRLVSHFQKSNGSNPGSSSDQSNRRWQEMERELKKLVEENIMLKKMISAVNNDAKTRGSSSRPGTPHGIGVSPGQNSLHQRGHYNSSVHGQTSPYSRSAPVTPQMMNSLKGSQRDTPKTPAGPIRLTIRTPPSNGMLGRIGTPPSGRLRTTPGIVANLLRAGNTPGAHDAKTPTGLRASLGDTHASGNSPTRRLSQHSDSSQRLPWSSSQPAISTTDRVTPGRQQTSSQLSLNNTPHKQHQYQTVRKQGSTVDLNRRQIQLHYQPRQTGH